MQGPVLSLVLSLSSSSFSLGALILTNFVDFKHPYNLKKITTYVACKILHKTAFNEALNLLSFYLLMFAMT